MRFAVLSAAFALTASGSSSSVTVCIGKKHTIDHNELYVARKAGFCGPGVKKLKWNKPNGHGTMIFCEGDPNDGSEFTYRAVRPQEGQVLQA